MTRVRVPAGLSVPAGDYEVESDAIDASLWDELRAAPGVEIECSRHPGSWWPISRADVPLAELGTWRCPSCAWAFRQGLAGRGGTPQF
jgi:hypothetical protein